MIKVSRVFCLFLIFIHGFAYGSATCMLASQVCVDGPSSKTIAGNSVYRDCWDYQSTYKCITPNSVDYCAALANYGCWETSSTCAVTAFDGSCMTQQKTYRCNDASLAAPTNTVKLDNTYTITKDELDTSQCDGYSNSSLCQIASHTCVDNSGTKVINGVSITKDCWEWKDEYTCINPTKQNDCQQYIDKGCSLLNETCITTDAKLGCTMDQFTYSCVSKGGVTSTVQDCSASSTCSANGICWDTSTNPDKDFAKAVATKEVAREIAVYSGGGVNLFNGSEDNCRNGYGGIRNCCKTSGVNSSNNSAATSIGLNAATSVVGWVANGAAQYGAAYMSDVLFDAATTAEGLGASYEAFGNAAYSQAADLADYASQANNLSIGAYGFIYSPFGAPSTLIGTATPIGGAGSPFYFNPAMFYIAIAIMVYQSLSSCDQKEMILSVKRGSNLCHLVGEYCDKEFLGACLETTQTYCCYNSLLAKIINEQGKAQIGKSWGTAHSPQCDGFSQTEFESIDFSKIDLTEFTASIMNATTIPTQDAVQSGLSNTLSTVSSKTSN